MKEYNPSIRNYNIATVDCNINLVHYSCVLSKYIPLLCIFGPQLG